MSTTFCFTGKSLFFDNRDFIKAFIEGQGGKFTSAVSSKTNFLVTNNPSSGSTKNRKAQELGIPVISENDMVAMALKLNPQSPYDSGVLLSRPSKGIMKALFKFYWGTPMQWLEQSSSVVEGVASEGGDVWRAGVECYNDGGVLAYQK